MIILPVGHDHTIRRLPVVTIGIMVVCLLIQLHRTVFAPWPHDFDAAQRAIADADKALIVHAISVGGKPAPAYDVESGPQQGDPNEGLQFDLTTGPKSGQPIVMVVPPGIEPVVNAVESGQPYDKILEQVHAGKLGDDRDGFVKAVHDAQKALDALEHKDIATRLAYVPSEGAFSINIVLAAFAHGGWLHLIGNMIFLWLCGCNLEDRWGRVPFAVFYLSAAVVANLAFMALHRHDGVGGFGASGAIAAAMGAFLVLFARARIQWMYIFFYRPKFFHTSALVAFPMWFLAQAFQLLFELSGLPGVAYSAHVGGFAFGLACAFGLKSTGLDDKLQKLSDDADEKGWEEHPDYVTALPLVETDPKAAVPLLRKVLVDRPTHEEARLSLAHAAARTSDTDLLGEVLPRAVGRLSTEERWTDLVALMQSIEPLLAPTGKVSLDERTSAQLLHAAVEGGDSKLCLRLARGHQTRFAGGHTMPRVLWDVAMAQRRAGAVPQSQQTLQRLLNEFPTHALAEKARQAIETAA